MPWRAGDHEFAITYREGSEKLFFCGVERPKPDRDLLFIPGDQWDSTVAPWARGRQDLILKRLHENRFVKRCEITEAQDSRIRN